MLPLHGFFHDVALLCLFLFDFFLLFTFCLVMYVGRFLAGWLPSFRFADKYTLFVATRAAVRDDFLVWHGVELIKGTRFGEG